MTIARLRVLIADEDPDSRVAARRALQRAELEVVAEGGYGTEAVSLSLEARPDVIMVAVEEPVGRPLDTAESLANALPDTPILLYSTMDDADSIRRAMVFGARDYLVKPLQAAGVREAVHRALEQEERRQMRRAGQLASVEARGTVITVTGAKGGIGKSVLSVNLALALRKQTGKAVAVIDADTQFGDIATFLDLTPAVTATELLENLANVDRQTVREFVVSHPSGIDIVATPSDDESWLKFGGEGIGAIIEQLARVYEFVVVDTAGSFDPFVKACMNASTLTLLVTSSDVSSVRDAGTAVKRTAKWGIDPARLRLVLNATSPSSDVKPAQIEAAVGLPIFWKLPHDKRVSKSIQLGRPIADAPGKSSFAASVTSLALLIAGTKTAIAPQPESAPAWRRLLQFRGRNNDAVMGTAKELSDI